MQGAGGRFPACASARSPSRRSEEAARLLDTVLATLPRGRARAGALACIDANGGVGALHVACYASHGFYADMRAWASLTPAERARRGDPYWQVWRIEGPGTIVHFKGHPHVHAYIQVVRDPARANLGESLGARSRRRSRASRMRALLEGALRRATGEALAFHADEIPGRFCAGEVTTGLAYALDPVPQPRGRGDDRGPRHGRGAARAARRAAAPRSSRRGATAWRRTEYFAGGRDEVSASRTRRARSRAAARRAGRAPARGRPGGRAG